MTGQGNKVAAHVNEQHLFGLYNPGQIINNNFMTSEINNLVCDTQTS